MLIFRSPPVCIACHKPGPTRGRACSECIATFNLRQFTLSQLVSLAHLNPDWKEDFASGMKLNGISVKTAQTEMDRQEAGVRSNIVAVMKNAKPRQDY